MFLKHLNPCSQALVSNTVHFFLLLHFLIPALLSSFHDTDHMKSKLQRRLETRVQAVSRTQWKISRRNLSAQSQIISKPKNSTTLRC